MITVTQKSESWIDTKRIHVLKKLTPSGAYATGGDTVDLSDFGVRARGVPIYADVQGFGGIAYSYKYIPGTTLTNGKLKVSTSGAELTAGNYPAAVLSDTITLYVICKR